MKGISIGIVCGIAALGFGVVYSMISKPDDANNGPLEPAQVVEQLAQEETEQQRKFRTMGIPADEEPECSLPKGWDVPKNLGDSPYTRNGLIQIMRIIALKKWQDTGSCDCFYNQITWDEVMSEAPKYERTDGIDLRFNLTELQMQADELEQQQLKACNP